jgi:hypothetical protein
VSVFNLDLEAIEARHPFIGATHDNPLADDLVMLIAEVRQNRETIKRLKERLFEYETGVIP